MKLLTLMLVMLLTGTAMAQQPFGHVLILTQENRTPDNLFGYCPVLLPGMDVIASGSPVPLGTTADIAHNHASFVREAAGTWPAAARHSVQYSDIAPYCDMLLQYASADRMFQTNQGPSEPAHDMLFSGTSAPSYPGELHADWFAMDNATQCIGQIQQTFISPDGVVHMLSSCKDHDTMGDRLTAANITWRYYTPSVGNIWTAPAGIRHICLPVAGKCTGQLFKDHVVINPAAVLTDISGGTLAQVSWVIPAGVNSDHPGYGSGGPAWIASIVNAVGTSPYWQDTAIIVVWDDWGGFYDHVPPLANTTGWCAAYCYGFRVPMMFISAYTQPGYVSHVPMDFGSILRFIEDNFSLGRVGDGTYADAYPQWDAGFYYLNLPPWQQAPARFKPIKAWRLTAAELSSADDPDSE